MLDWVEEAAQGPWSIEHFEITKEKALIYQIGSYGSYTIAPRPGKYTRLMHENRGVVMSDTRQELVMMESFSHRLTLGLKGDNKNVHINGLGLGIAAKWALDYGYNVTVCEIDPDVIVLTGTVLDRMYPDKLRIINASALDYKPENTEKLWAVYHDIWDNADLEYWDQYKLLHRRWGRKTLWQDSWGRDFLLKQKREERRAWW